MKTAVLAVPITPAPKSYAALPLLPTILATVDAIAAPYNLGPYSPIGAPVSGAPLVAEITSWTP